MAGLFTPRRALWVVLAATYAAFAWWYGGTGTPLGAAERERLVAALRGELGAGERGGEGALERIEAFAATDDGREFFMVNLIAWRRDAEGRAILEPNTRYLRFMLPRLLARASHPVFAGEPIASLVEDGGAARWDQIGVVRYRSRRDFLEIVATPAYAAAVENKWASVEKTLVFPATAILAPIGPRAVVFVLLLAVGVAGHLGLRRRSLAAS